MGVDAIRERRSYWVTVLFVSLKGRPAFLQHGGSAQGGEGIKKMRKRRKEREG